MCFLFSVKVVICLLWPLDFSGSILILKSGLLFLHLITGSSWEVHYFHCWLVVLIAWFSNEETWVEGNGRAGAVWVSVGKLSVPAKVSRGSHFPTKLQGDWPAATAEWTQAHVSNSIQTPPKPRRPAGTSKTISQAGTLPFRDLQIPPE